MTDLQKTIFTVLIKGGSIAKTGQSYRLRDDGVNPVSVFTYRTWFIIRRFVRLDRKLNVFVLDRKKVRALHGKSWLKQQYKMTLNKDNLHENAF